tara:strand:- start:87 stop:197 length:111 start_codon:yes stop_codon:yes gene_type:complete
MEVVQTIDSKKIPEVMAYLLRIMPQQEREENDYFPS